MKTMGIIFSNMYDADLSELTGIRTVASLPYGGRYRQIDFLLSNMSNSGIYNIGIITKYNYRSLMDHLGSCAEWDLNRKNESVVFLPPFAEGESSVYHGKLEALYTAIHFLDNPEYDYVLTCDPTVLCNIDFRKAIAHHIRSGCEVTVIANKETEETEEPRSLLLKTNRKNVVTDLLIDAQVRPGYYSGMGMFIFDRKKLLETLGETHSRGLVHLERDYLQRRFNEKSIKINVAPFSGVVLRNRSIEMYYRNSMRLLEKDVRRDLFNPDFPIYTKVRDEAPAYYGTGSRIDDSLIADGCTIYGSVEKSILFRDVVVRKGASVRGSVIMQGVRIGENATLQCVILDKNVTVSDYTVLVGTPDHPVIIRKGETV